MINWGIIGAGSIARVFCNGLEKPIALNHAEACAMVDAARANDVFLMEAFMYRCHPQIARARALIRQSYAVRAHSRPRQGCLPSRAGL